MTSLIFDILRQGLWASITGGWYYDPHHSTFINTVHLYIFLLFLCFPLTVQLYFPCTVFSWMIYVTIISCVFVALKIINCNLHHMYDTTEGHYDQPLGSNPQLETDKKKLNQKSETRVTVEEEGIELQVLNSDRKESDSQMTANNDIDMSSMESCSDITNYLAPSASCLQKIAIDLNVDVHRKNSSDSSEDVCNVTDKTNVYVHEAGVQTEFPSTVKKTRSEKKQEDELVGMSDKDVTSCPSRSIADISKDGPSTTLDSSGSAAGRLSETSRRYSASVTLGGTEPPPVISDPGPSRSLQLDEDLNKTQKEETGLLFWKQKWDNATEHSRSESIISPSDIYKSDIIYSISEQSNEHKQHNASSNQRGSLCSEDDYCIDDGTNEIENEDADYGDAEEDANSHSPLLASKQVKKTSSLEAVRSPSSHLPLNESASPRPGKFRQLLRRVSIEKSDKQKEFQENSNCVNSCNKSTDNEKSVSSPNLQDHCQTERSPDSTSEGSPYSSTFSWLFFLTENEREDQNKRNCNESTSPKALSTSKLEEINKNYEESKNASSLHEEDGLNRDLRLQRKRVMRKRNQRCSSNPALSMAAIQEKQTVGDKKNDRNGNGTDLNTGANICENTECGVCFLPPVVANENFFSECSTTKDDKLEQIKVPESYAASSSSSNNELTTLLPAPTTSSVIPKSASQPTRGSRPSPPHIPLPRRLSMVAYENYNRSSINSNHGYGRHRRPRAQRPTIPLPPLSSREESSNGIGPYLRDMYMQDAQLYAQLCGRHVATTHDDTSDGAMHIFQDENGEWMSYAFDSKGCGMAVPLGSMTKPKSGYNIEEYVKTMSHSNHGFDNCTMFVNSGGLRSHLTENLASTSSAMNNNQLVPLSDSGNQLYQIRENDNGTFSFERVENPLVNVECHQLMSSTTSSLRVNPLSTIPLPMPLIPSASLPRDVEADIEALARINRFDFMDSIDTAEEERRASRYYKFLLCSFIRVKIYFDRLQLLALFDYNRRLSEIAFCILLFSLVSLFGSMILYIGFYKDIEMFIFCLVMAGSQYSLLKSVQPDASSPTHGFNKMVVFSRPVYFIICSSLILLLNYTLNSKEHWSTFEIYGQCCDPKWIIQNIHDFLLNFILFFPIFFAFGLFPQINTFLMYFFEQTDMHIFGGNAVISLKASIYCFLRSILTVLLLFGLAYAGLNEPKSTQHIIFSIYVTLLVLTAFHLSKLQSDPEPIWYLVKKHFLQIDNTKRTKVKKHRRKQPQRNASNDEQNSKRISHNSPSPSQMKDTVLVPMSIGSSTWLPDKAAEEDKNEYVEDCFPSHLRCIISERVQSDIIVSLVVGLVLFAIHRSTVFAALQPEFNPIMWTSAIVIGFVLHYLFPQMRKQLPWMCIARPILVPFGMEQYEPREPSRVTFFEKIYLYVGFVERNIIYPVMFVACITSDGPRLTEKVGPLLSSILITLCGLKCLRLSFSNTSCQYVILVFCVLLFQEQYIPSETFVVDYFVTSIVYFKLYDLILKAKFVMTYIAPWQITWGSAFHAFAQPFSLPHTGILFIQIVLSAVLSSPLYPFLGSAIFLTSYPRPIKFWERDYNTRRVDHSNTKMSSHLERNLGADDNNLNSIFYEHLTRSLQTSLCGDLNLGRWGEVSSGDCFVLASDYLNCMIHIVEVGNGLVTFQMRGLEFRGTYCQQREVEAITEGVDHDDGCCCCKPGHLPNMLALNVAFSQRWLAWEVIGARYVLEGYSISDNPAASMLQVFDFRKMLISYYVKSIIYFTFSSNKMHDWISNKTIMETLQPLKDKNFVDLDLIFNMNIDEDYDHRMSGITRNSFCNTYLTWIRYCNSVKKHAIPDVSKDSCAVTLCFALSLLGRRALGTASHNTAATVEFFLYGLHALFKGDFRIASTRDEWVFMEIDLLQKVVAPAIRMALKLHQDHFMAPDEFESLPALYASITAHRKNIVISHEGDPVWRKAILKGVPSLLALRRVIDDGSDEYKVIMLNKSYLGFRLIKLNRECVRGLWAGQQQELVYLRNRNPERGSIQNAKQVLRNIINSSCDQPIGYPIFVSPLTTSYVETNKQVVSHLWGTITIKSLKSVAVGLWERLRHRCVEGCSSGSSVPSQDDGGFGHEGIYAMTTFNVHTGFNSTPPPTQVIETSLVSTGGGTVNRVSRSNVPLTTSKPGSTSLVALAGLLSPPGSTAIPDSLKNAVEKKFTEKDEDEKEIIMNRVRIIDPVQVHDGINQGRLIDVIWPDEVMRQCGGRNFWKDWVPEVGMEGQVVHRWVPNHPNPNKRSTFDRTILLVKIDDKYVPISENGVHDLGAEV